MLLLMEAPWRSLSVFYPAFNESAILVGLLDHAHEVLDGMGIKHYEIIIIDDGSTDSTPQLLAEYMRLHPRVRVVRHEQNRGYGAALVSGFAAAQYDWVVYTDSDGQFDLADLAKFAEASKRSAAVVGFRRRRSDHAGRRFNAWLWARAVEAILGLKVRDLDCGFKLLRRDVLRQLEPFRSTGAVISAELFVGLRAHGVEWEEVAVEHFERQGGRPTGARLRVILRALRELWSLRRTVRAS